MLLSPKQREFVKYGTHRWNFKGGATRSGKTYLDFRWIIPIRIRERIGKDGLAVILGVTKSTIERNVLEPMRNLYGDTRSIHTQHSITSRLPGRTTPITVGAIPSLTTLRRRNKSGQTTGLTSLMEF